MPKKECVCIDCDSNFTVTHKTGNEVKFCPFCGSEICDEESNYFEDEELFEDE